MKNFYRVGFFSISRGRGNFGKVYSLGENLVGKIIPSLNYESAKKVLEVEYSNAKEAISRGLRLPEYKGIFDLFNFKSFRKMPLLVMRDLGEKSLDKLVEEELDLAMKSRNTQLNLARKKGVHIYDPFLSNSIWVPEEGKTYLIDPYKWTFSKDKKNNLSFNQRSLVLDEEIFSEFQI